MIAAAIVFALAMAAIVTMIAGQRQVDRTCCSICDATLRPDEDGTCPDCWSAMQW